jgi:hypothetical protein
MTKNNQLQCSHSSCIIEPIKISESSRESKSNKEKETMIKSNETTPIKKYKLKRDKDLEEYIDNNQLLQESEEEANSEVEVNQEEARKDLQEHNEGHSRQESFGSVMNSSNLEIERLINSYKKK